MQKHNKHKHLHIRPPHIRVSAVAIAIATGFHISGIGHFGHKSGYETATINTMRAYHSEAPELARENETARHMVRFDEGLRLPSTSGSSV